MNNSSMMTIMNQHKINNASIDFITTFGSKNTYRRLNKRGKRIYAYLTRTDLSTTHWLSEAVSKTAKLSCKKDFTSFPKQHLSAFYRHFSEFIFLGCLVRSVTLLPVILTIFGEIDVLFLRIRLEPGARKVFYTH